jgi:hypothetical protein
MRRVSESTHSRLARIVLPAALGALLMAAGPGLDSVSVAGWLQAEGQELPDADDLIRAYVEAIGGRDAHTGATSVRTRGTIRIEGMELEGSFELLQITDVGSRMHSSIPGMGNLVVGFDGEVGWSVNPMGGPELMDEEELEEIRERSLLDATLRDPAVVPERETVGEDEVRGEPCFRVRLRWESGRETFDCYSRERGLLLRSEEVRVTPMGEIPSTTVFSGYREFSGLVLPTRIAQESMGLTHVMELEEVILDDAGPEALEPPEEIQALLEGR